MGEEWVRDEGGMGGGEKMYRRSHTQWCVQREAENHLVGDVFIAS